MLRDAFHIKNKENIKNQFLKGINIITFLLILNLLAGNFGIHNIFFNRVLAFFLLLAALLININPRELFVIIKDRVRNSMRKLLFGLMLIFLSLVLLFATSSREFWLIQLPIFILGLNTVIQSIEYKKTDLTALLISSFLYALFIIVIQNAYILYYAIQQFSIAVSQGVGHLSQTVTLGPSASGLWMLISFLFYIVSSFLISEKRKEKKTIYLIVGSMLTSFLAWIVYILVQSLYEFESLPDRINAQYMLFILLSITILIFTLKGRTKSYSFDIPRLKEMKFFPFLRKWKVLTFIVLLLISSIFLTTLTPGLSKDKANVAIYQPGIDVGALDVPEYGRYGRYASGFFGLLPEYLETFNYDVEIVTENVTQDILARSDVLVIINLGEMFSDQSLEVIWNFVENGGSILVMGDHTDIGGIMNPLNDLLDPVGISFRFDSAIPIKSRWKSCYHLMHHPITEGLQSSHYIDISVGASLDIDVTKSAFPIILGKGGFSDIGSYLNVDRSYLGDYEVNPGEQLGDVILTAGSFYGDGKVVVFGDTSSFQNLAISTSNRLVSNVFSWLTSNDTGTTHYLRIGISLILLGIALFIFVKLKMKFFFLLPIILCISLILSATINASINGERDVAGPVFYIDYSHGERINRDYYEDDSVTGFMINLIRNEYTDGNRYLPFVMDDYSQEKILKSKIFVLIAPTKSFTGEEVATIKSFVSNGGLLILSTGYNDKDASELILDTFGFDILATPLGPVPYIDENPEVSENEPRFVDSWPISIEENNNDVQIFYSIQFDEEAYPLVVFKKYGDGGILLIGDSDFLLDDNLESLYDYWPGNIEFIKSIMEELRKEGVPK